MRDAALERYAGRFVWLELDYDKEVNQPFLTGHGVQWTPTLMVMDPSDERVTAEHNGGVSIAELSELLERGERGVRARPAAPAEQAERRGDELAGRGDYVAAAAEYGKALALGGAAWPARARTADALTSALVVARDERACVTATLGYASKAPHDPSFARIVRAGLGCANDGGDATWAVAARTTLEPLAAEAIGLAGVLRDDRFQLYQQLVASAQLRHDTVAATRWGDRWLQEIDAIHPAGDDERSALDIARVDAVSLLGQPERALAALAASERAMPTNGTAAMRYAEIAADAEHYDESLAASARGLALVDGPMQRTRLLWIRARAFIGKNARPEAHSALAQAAKAADEIGNASARAGYLRRIAATRSQLDKR